MQVDGRLKTGLNHSQNTRVITEGAGAGAIHLSGVKGLKGYSCIHIMSKKQTCLSVFIHERVLVSWSSLDEPLALQFVDNKQLQEYTKNKNDEEILLSLLHSHENNSLE